MLTAHMRIGLEGIGEAVGILAHDEMPFLQAQHALRLDPEGTQALRRSRASYSACHTCAAAARGDMDLIAEFAHESDAQQPRRDARDSSLARRQIRETTPRPRSTSVKVCRISRLEGAGKIEGRAMAGHVHQRAIETP